MQFRYLLTSFKNAAKDAGPKFLTFSEILEVAFWSSVILFKIV